MNSVILIGRLTRDAEVRYTQSDMAVATFTLAVDRPVKRGEDKQADFPRVTCFGKTAELVEKYTGKGMMLGVVGRLQTGSYEKNGQKVYTTDVIADRVEFLSKVNKDDAPSGFAALDDNDSPW